MLRIRLRRQGARNAPHYRIVVSDGRKTPRNKASMELGYYDPTQNPPVVNVDRERAQAWIRKGAVPSETVRQLLVPPPPQG